MKPVVGNRQPEISISAGMKHEYNKRPMNHDRFNLQEAIAVLERSPAGIFALLNGLPDTWISATEGEGTWSPYDVIGHLIHGERTDWIPRVRHIMAGGARPFESFDRNAQFQESQDRDLPRTTRDVHGIAGSESRDAGEYESIGGRPGTKRITPGAGRGYAEAATSDLGRA